MWMRRGPRPCLIHKLVPDGTGPPSAAPLFATREDLSIWLCSALNGSIACPGRNADRRRSVRLLGRAVLCGLFRRYDDLLFAVLGTSTDPLRGRDQGPTWNLWQDQHRPTGPQLRPGPGAPMMEGGLWQIITICAIGAFASWALREVEICAKAGHWLSCARSPSGVAIFAYVTLVVIRPVLLGAWGHGFPYGILSHLDWVSNVGYQYLHFHYNPAHMIAVTFFFTTTAGACPARFADPLGGQSTEEGEWSRRRNTRTRSSATRSAIRSARSGFIGSACSSP